MVTIDSLRRKLAEKASTSRFRGDKREFKKTTTAAAARTSLNKGFNEQNNSCARALQTFVHCLENVNRERERERLINCLNSMSNL